MTLREGDAVRGIERERRPLFTPALHGTICMVFFCFGDSFARICGFVAEVALSRCENVLRAPSVHGPRWQNVRRSHARCQCHIVLVCNCKMKVCLPCPKDFYLVWDCSFSCGRGLVELSQPRPRCSFPFCLLAPFPFPFVAS